MCPNMNSRRSVPTSVNGIQKVPRSRSLIARFSKKTFVTVLILLSRTKVRMTNPFPRMHSKNKMPYNGILTCPFSHRTTSLELLFITSDKVYKVVEWLMFSVLKSFPREADISTSICLQALNSPKEGFSSSIVWK